jgi:hypothetical protein
MAMVLTIPGKFSKIRHVIEKRYRDDETFREVYDDYLEYLKAHGHWVQASSDEAPLRRREYAELVGELENELTQLLNEKASAETDDLKGRKLK